MKKIYLLHAGIKGQRWGVRRFQNEDGSLTALGKQRYGTASELERDYRRADAEAAKATLDGTSKSLTTAGKVVQDIGSNKSKLVNNKDYSKISDEELRTRINRLNMERSYGELTGDTQRVRSGSDWTREVLQTTGAVVGIGGTIAGILVAMGKVGLKGAETKKGGK